MLRQCPFCLKLYRKQSSKIKVYIYLNKRECWTRSKGLILVLHLIPEVLLYSLLLKHDLLFLCAEQNPRWHRNGDCVLWFGLNRDGERAVRHSSQTQGIFEHITCKYRVPLVLLLAKSMCMFFIKVVYMSIWLVHDTSLRKIYDSFVWQIYWNLS